MQASTVPLGDTGIRVSPLCFGTMSFGGDADEATSAAMFHRCRDAGLNFFDCANVYSDGRAEEILGRLIVDCRDDVVITSKVFGQMGDEPAACGLGRRNIAEAIDASLQRLGTDRIDIYFAHQFDAGVPMSETIEAMDKLVAQGKIRHFGVSNWAAWQTAKALGIAAVNDWAPITCLQPMYSLAKRQAEVEIMPLASADNLGVIPYSPLGGGLLSGKYGADKKPNEPSRLMDNSMYSQRYRLDTYYQVAERFCEYARDHGEHPVSLAVAWVGGHTAVTAPIIGARNLEQLEPSLKAMDISMPPERRSEIAALAPAPAPANDRLEEV